MSQTILHLLLNSIRQYPEKDALRYKGNGGYTGISYRAFGEMIENLARGLAVMGIKPGDRIAILSNNRPEWPICDFAIFSVRAIVIPVYQTLPPNQIAYILNDAGVRAIFVEDQLQYDKIQQIKEKCSDLEFVFPITEVKSEAQSPLYYHDILAKGELHRKSDPDFYRNSIEAIQPEETCSMVYTSGTTGEPKGVMLNHVGFIHDVVNSEAVFKILPDDVFLSFLPLSHLYERLGGHWCPLYRGATIAYAGSIDTVVDDIQLVRPTVMVSVPRLYEKISSRVMEQVELGSSLKKKLFYWALKTGRSYHTQRYEGKPDGMTSFYYKFADKIVFKKIKQKLGGRFRFPISGGAPLGVETLKFFEAMGLQIVEGYGMTETHLIISLTPPGSTKYGSCGKPIPGVEVRIADDGEILVKGVTVMKGYYNKPELTGEVIDSEGWLHTGDVGYLDEDNYLFITDRKKNILVTAGGKNVAPAPIENALKHSRFIEDVFLVGNRRKFISAVIIPDFESLKKVAQENNIPANGNKDYLNDEKILEIIWNDIERLQEDFARYEKVKKFILLTEPLSVDKGELTPSLKIKRDVVETKYKALIEGLYVE